MNLQNIEQKKKLVLLIENFMSEEGIEHGDCLIVIETAPSYYTVVTNTKPGDFLYHVAELVRQSDGVEERESGKIYIKDKP